MAPDDRLKHQRVDSKSPLYLQLREVIRSRIESGEYPPGTCIPSESAFAQTYGIHRLSVRSAISALIYEGMLKSVQGKGVYVVGKRIERDMETIGGFKQTMLERNQEPSTKILVKARRPAGAFYAHKLHICPQDGLYYIKRICAAGGSPVSLEEIFIPEYLVPTQRDVDLDVFSVYEIYAFYGIEITRVEQTLDLSYLSAMDARLIGVDSGRAVLEFQCLSYDANDRAIEYARTFTRSDKCVFNVHYQKR